MAAALTLVAVACLPDLEAVPPASDEAGTGEDPGGCGDGVIAWLDDGRDAGESCDPGNPANANAQAPGCEECQVRCEGTLDPATHHCYFASGVATEYSAAIARCTGGAHVVTFSGGESEQRIVAALVGDASYWVGLSRKAALRDAYGPDREPREEPGYPYPDATGPCAGCFGPGAEDGGHFPLEDPSATRTECLAGRHGTWKQVACVGALSRTIVCEREPVGMRAQFCVGGFCFTVPKTAGHKTYFVSTSAADSAEASASCASLAGGGSLVVFDSSEEREQVAHEILAWDPAPVEQRFWIGLVSDAGAWSWEARPSLAADRLPWGNAEPKGEGPRAFLHLSKNAYDTQLARAESDVLARHRFICERPSQTR